jgi:hypothetical protein
MNDTGSVKNNGISYTGQMESIIIILNTTEELRMMTSV